MLFYHASVVSFSTSLLFSSHESVRQDVECRWSDGGFPSEWGGRRAGFHVWVTVGRKGVTFLFVRIMGWQPRWRSEWGWVMQGPLGSFTPIITFTAAGAGLSGRTRAGKKKISHDVHSLSMLDGLELNGDNEVDPVEYRWVKHCGVAAQHEWMSFKKGTSMLSQTSLDKQRLNWNSAVWMHCFCWRASL